MSCCWSGRVSLSSFLLNLLLTEIYCHAADALTATVEETHIDSRGHKSLTGLVLQRLMCTDGEESAIRYSTVCLMSPLYMLARV